MTVRSYRAKKGTYGGKIRYQLRIQRHIVGCDFDKETITVSGVKIGLLFKNRYFNIEKCQILSAILRRLFSFFEDASCK